MESADCKWYGSYKVTIGWKWMKSPFCYFCLFVYVVVFQVEKTTWDWELINTNKPIWSRKPKDVKDEEYNEFYKSFTKVSSGTVLCVVLKDWFNLYSCYWVKNQCVTWNSVTFWLFSWIVSFPCHEKSFYINKKDEDKKSVSQ